MYQNTCALEAGASLDQACAAYLEEHPLDHDDDSTVERCTVAFRDPDQATLNLTGMK